MRSALFDPEAAGTRCLLDHPAARQAAIQVGIDLCRHGLLNESAVAIQAIAFDKNATTNWKVAWHQDLVFPFARPVQTPGFAVPSVKDGIDHARPPVEVLAELVIARVHLDACTADSGPLRISPGTHRYGILAVEQIAARVAVHGSRECWAEEAEAVVMSPLLLHASSKANRPEHRRVLHLVYHSGRALSESWHRAIPITSQVAVSA